MKLFLDTNIFMDMLFERENCISAKQIIQLIQDGIHDGYVADITLLNIDYVAKKQLQEIRLFLHFIENNFAIIGAKCYVSLYFRGIVPAYFDRNTPIHSIL